MLWPFDLFLRLATSTGTFAAGLWLLNQGGAIATVGALVSILSGISMVGTLYIQAVMKEQGRGPDDPNGTA